MTNTIFRVLQAIKLATSVLAMIPIGAQPVLAQKPIDFAHEIVPVLRKHCAECHSGDNRKGSFSIDTRSDILKGSENGLVIELGKSAASRIMDLLTSDIEGERMPPEGARVSPREVELLKRWIDAGVPWEDGFAFRAPAYEPPLKPRNPELPAARNGRMHPIDRVIDNHIATFEAPVPGSISDEAFARRSALDITGLLPETEKLQRFLNDKSPNRRASFIDALLADDEAYAEHWLTFWNDLLRNDYGGTGFITGGRKQISGWLYDSLLTNKPYNRFVHELIAPPTDASRGFIEGIKWRGEVSAGQTVEIQFAQSVSQSLLGINMKCASCHDSFVDRWKLDEAYGLAAIYSSKDLEIHRCDKAIGRIAKAKWLFPELGDVDATAKPDERLRQLADLMTHPENGRFTRTIVNRLWHRMMGRGIVHPTDSMHTEPWCSDLLDMLASDFLQHGYDLKHTLRFIANSAAYQSQTEVLTVDADTRAYSYHGPRAKRMTAEQFIDTVWQLTDAAPTRMDATFVRGKVGVPFANSLSLTANWIWSTDGKIKPHASGEKRSFRKQFQLPMSFGQAGAVITCDNRFTMFLNGKKVASGDNWETPVGVRLQGLVTGKNELLVVAENQGNAPNPAGLFFEAKVWSEGVAPESDAPLLTLVSDGSWEFTAKTPNDKGKYAKEPKDWQPAVAVAAQGTWSAVVPKLQAELARSTTVSHSMVRASLLKSDPMMRALGRPNRDQIVSMRPNELTTLEAMELANGSILANTLTTGAENLFKVQWLNNNAMVEWLYPFAYSRSPNKEELSVANELLGSEMTARGIEDLLWVVVMQPEFQWVR